MAPVLPRRLVTIDLSHLYPGFSCEAWASAPISKTDRLFTTADETELRTLLLDLFPSWDFGDEEGNPIPHEIDSFDAMPRELVVAMIKGYQNILSGLPADFGQASPRTSA